MSHDSVWYKVITKDGQICPEYWWNRVGPIVDTKLMENRRVPHTITFTFEVHLPAQACPWHIFTSAATNSQYSIAVNIVVVMILVNVRACGGGGCCSVCTCVFVCVGCGGGVWRGGGGDVWTGGGGGCGVGVRGWGAGDKTFLRRRYNCGIIKSSKNWLELFNKTNTNNTWLNLRRPITKCR